MTGCSGGPSRGSLPTAPSPRLFEVRAFRLGRLITSSLLSTRTHPRAQLDIALQEVCRNTDPATLQTPVSDRAVRELKFSECLPPSLAVKVLSERMTDAPAT